MERGGKIAIALGSGAALVATVGGCVAAESATGIQVTRIENVEIVGNFVSVQTDEGVFRISPGDDLAHLLEIERLD